MQNLMKIVLVWVLCLILCDQALVSAVKRLKFQLNPRVTTGSFDFREVVRENQKYPPVPERCQLRIYGGVEVARGDTPYQVDLKKQTTSGEWKVFCSGAIITDEYVLTTAHCFDNAPTGSVRVVAGIFTPAPKVEEDEIYIDTTPKIEPEEIWRNIAVRHTHAWYKNEERQVFNDLAILKLSSPLIFSEAISAIPIITKDVDLPDNTLCLTSGYGFMENTQYIPTLRMVCLPIVNYKTCKDFYGTQMYSNYSLMCAGVTGKDNCQGGSGAPMVCKGRLAGLVSITSNCNITPGIYTRLAAFTTGVTPFSTTSRSLKLYHTLYDSIGIIILWYISTT